MTADAWHRILPDQQCPTIIRDNNKYKNNNIILKTSKVSPKQTVVVFSANIPGRGSPFYRPP